MGITLFGKDSRKPMNSRKFFLTMVSASLVGVGVFLLLRGVMLQRGALLISFTLALVSAAALFTIASNLSNRAVRIFVGPSLLFGAIWFGVQNDGQMFAIAVLWAGVLFGALDSLSNVLPRRSGSI